VDTAPILAALLADEAKLEKLGARYGADEISEKEWLAARAPINERLQANRAKLTAAQQHQAIPDLQDLGARWDALELEQRRAVIMLLIDAVDIGPAKLRGPRFDPDRVDIRWKA
jgi:hypothetical protein